MRFDGVDRRSGLRVRRRVALVKGDLHQLDAASGERLGKMRDLFAVDAAYNGDDLFCADALDDLFPHGKSPHSL